MVVRLPQRTQLRGIIMAEERTDWYPDFCPECGLPFSEWDECYYCGELDCMYCHKCDEEDEEEE